MGKKSDERSITIGRDSTWGLECAPSEVELKGEARCRRGGVGRINARCRSRMVENKGTDMEKNGKWETRQEQDRSGLLQRGGDSDESQESEAPV